MDLYIKIVAWVLVVLNILAILIVPSKFGKSRGEYSFSYWIAAIISFLLEIPIYLRALGII